MEYKGYRGRMQALRVSVIFLVISQITYGDVSYSIQEEMKRGSVIGNIAKDLGLDVKGLSARNARLDSEGTGREFCDINLKTGDLIVAGRIDREELCGEKASCPIKYELVLENPLELQRITLQIQDINDNTPVFSKDQMMLEILESANKGSRFPVNEAHDPDIGENAVQSYTLQKNEYFYLDISPSTYGGKYAELILEKELDREQKEELTLLLTAADGGTPQRSVLHQAEIGTDV
ncbi:protocadherin gamma-C3 [Brienomyrus brachyistius]|uniref:protocadherin gamma-C3 n=1 Tax=Brienomyrus brachyistius TaxID=42636 RepID=UPI0020B30073|nr:protocadherin gamma-C3 [Brienomyrus brachyistius]